MSVFLRDITETSHTIRDLLLEGPRRALVGKLVQLDFMPEPLLCTSVDYAYSERDDTDEGVRAFDQKRLVVVFEGNRKRALGPASTVKVVE